MNAPIGLHGHIDAQSMCVSNITLEVMMLKKSQLVVPDGYLKFVLRMLVSTLSQGLESDGMDTTRSGGCGFT